MRRPILLPRRSDVLGILLVLAVTAVFALWYVIYPNFAWQNASQASFGPDWECQSVPAGENICVKKVSKTPAR